LIPIIINYF